MRVGRGAVYGDAVKLQVLRAPYLDTTAYRNRWDAKAACSVSVLALVCLLGACGAPGPAHEPFSSRAQRITHEDCSEADRRVEAVDANGDGRADIRRVLVGSREVCRISDVNQDGRPDLFEYYDARGLLRRREADYDEDGKINVVEHYENGRMTRVESDTNGRGRVDTWDFFDPATGRRSRRERDASGSGRVDQWWTFDGDRVSILLDRDGDGQPDPGEPLVLAGSEGKGEPETAVAYVDAGAPPIDDGGRQR